MYQMSDFKEEIASCRTFVFLKELEVLADKGLIKGGDIDNAVVLVTGGGTPQSSAEIWSPTRLNCNIPNMTKGRKYHVQFTDGDAVTVCGGGNDNTCETLKDGQWRVSHTWQQTRSSSSVWKSGDATYIIGGWDPESVSKTSEKINTDGSLERGFSLKYEAR